MDGNPLGDDKDNDQYSEEEATRRAKEALRRAFKTSPQPRKPTDKKGESPAKPTPKRAPVKRRGKSD